MEIWKDVVGYEGLYEVSNKGRIKSINLYAHKEPIIMSLSKRKDGYLSVGLSKDGKVKPHTVHRLVALAFLDNPDGLEMINHKDENKANNCVENLEWCSRAYNQLYSIKKHPDRKKKFGNNFIDKNTGKLTSPFTQKGVPHTYKMPVVKKDKEGNVIERYDNAAQAAYKNNVAVGNLINSCKRKLKPDSERKRKRRTSNGINGFIYEFVMN